MFQTKKSLGQHFLRSDRAIKAIVESAQLVSNDIILEIGPGEGVLTKAILETRARLIAIEKDHRLISYLKNKFADHIISGQLLVIEGDMLDPNTQKLLFELPTMRGVYKLVANIPYYITGQLFRLFLEQLPQPTLMTVLVQKEVARQIVAQNNKESILSVAVKAYGEPRYVETVKRGAFMPPPGVDSAILCIEHISKNNFDGIDEKEFFTIVRSGFHAKRKMLLGNLVRELNVPKEKTEQLFAELGIKAKIRAEDLPPQQWFQLARKIKM